MTGMLESVLHPEHGWIEMGGRFALAIVLGGVIGFERERRHRPAGLRTHMMVSLASASFAVLMINLAAEADRLTEAIMVDPMRLFEAIIAGVAFLGAGTIIQARGRVRGITTGTSMWLAGAIGLGCGAGFYLTALLTAGFGLVILLGVGLLARRYLDSEKAGEPDDEGAPGSG